MKVKNESVNVKIGNKETVFKNLILNNYLEKFTDSFLNFEDKILSNCFIKFNTTQDIDENSIQMDYDVVLEANLTKLEQIFTSNSVINKYTYDTPVWEEANIEDYYGKKICGIGFGELVFAGHTIYAFLDVSEYNLRIQEGQEFVISRTDKIISDLLFYSQFKDINCPLHLTIKGIIGNLRAEEDKRITKLCSIGLGEVYNVIEKEISLEQLDVKKEEKNCINISNIKEFANYPSENLFPSSELYPGFDKETIKKITISEEEGLYPSSLLFPSKELYLRKSQYRWIIYKFAIYKAEFDNPTYDPMYRPEYKDTGEYYYQSQYVNDTGDLKLKIKFERS